jgi:hypothetical protein
MNKYFIEKKLFKKNYDQNKHEWNNYSENQNG